MMCGPLKEKTIKQWCCLSLFKFNVDGAARGKDGVLRIVKERCYSYSLGIKESKGDNYFGSSLGFLPFVSRQTYGRN